MQGGLHPARLVRMREGFSVLRSALATLVGVYLQFFGLFASWQMDRFLLALFVPPYAWFNSVAYWFEPSKAEREWDEHVQALAHVIFLDGPDLVQADERQKEAARRVRAWLKEIPAFKREELRKTMRAWIEESPTILFNTAAGKEIFPQDVERMALIRREAGVVREMNKYKALSQAEVRRLFGMPEEKPFLDTPETRKALRELMSIAGKTQLADWFGPE